MTDKFEVGKRYYSGSYMMDMDCVFVSDHHVILRNDKGDEYISHPTNRDLYKEIVKPEIEISVLHIYNNKTAQQIYVSSVYETYSDKDTFWGNVGYLSVTYNKTAGTVDKIEVTLYKDKK